MPERRRFPLVRLVGTILICEAAGGVGVLATRNALSDWYQRLNKPSFNPPGWVFGPTWTTLYLLMGIADTVAMTSDGEDTLKRLAQRLFAVQLGFNAAWSFIFFGRRSPGGALIEIVFLWAAVLMTTAAFFRLSKLAGILMIPYLVWTTFAAVLNQQIWQLNQ